MTVVVRRPGPPLDGLVRAITYQAGEQQQTSVEKILPGAGAGLWVNLNQDEFRSFGDSGQVTSVPGAMLAGPASHATVIEFEAGRAHVSVTFALGAAACFAGAPLAVARDEMVPLAELWGDPGACLRERLLGCSGWSATSTGRAGSTGPLRLPGTGTPTSRIWPTSSATLSA